MPGLVGFSKRNLASEGAEVLLRKMAKALESEDRFMVNLHHEAGLGLGRVSLDFVSSETQPVWNEDRSLCLIMEGELYDSVRLKRDLVERGHHFKVNNDAELILHSYEEFGEDFAGKLNGAFAVALWEERSRKLLLANDRLGLYPIYYARVKGDLIFASGVRALLADPELHRSVDLVALNQFLVYDHVLDDRTLLSLVSLLPQGSVLTFCENLLRIRPYWALRYPDTYEQQHEDAYVDQFTHYLRQAVERQNHDNRPTGILLSGGLDSRILSAMLSDSPAAKSLHSFTFGIPGCDDARLAREVAASLGTQHHFYKLKPDWLCGLAKNAVRITDGLGNIVNLHALATLEEEVQHAQVLYKGFMGDAMLGFALKRQMWADYPVDTRYQVHLGIHSEHGVINYDRPEQDRLLTSTFQSQVGDAVYETYRDGMDKSGVSQLANQRLYFDLTQRVPRMTIKGVEVLRSRAIVRLPFCDNDLLDFVLTVPPGFLFERYLAKEALVRNYPQLAQIPLAGTGRTLKACARDILIQSKALLSWHLQRIGIGWTNGTHRRPYKDYNNWFRTALRQWTEKILLDRHTLERGYFNPASVRQLVAEHMAGRDHAVRLGALLTIELWHRQFLD